MAKRKKKSKLLESPTIMRPKAERFKDRYEIQNAPRSECYHPEHQKPSSDLYRKNYDEIFRKKE